uniref:Transmembrane protein n=1 Tax=Heterorhabditis bacteriophora TaxID=37862 RepID=A0A1I7WT07_HETBA
MFGSTRNLGNSNNAPNSGLEDATGTSSNSQQRNINGLKHKYHYNFLVKYIFFYNDVLRQIVSIYNQKMLLLIKIQVILQSSSTSLTWETRIQCFVGCFVLSIISSLCVKYYWIIVFLLGSKLFFHVYFLICLPLSNETQLKFIYLSHIEAIRQLIGSCC